MTLSHYFIFKQISIQIQITKKLHIYQYDIYVIYYSITTKSDTDIDN